MSTPNNSELDEIKHILGHCPAKSHICWYSKTEERLKKEFPGDTDTQERALCHYQDQVIEQYIQKREAEAYMRGAEDELKCVRAGGHDDVQLTNKGKDGCSMPNNVLHSYNKSDSNMTRRQHGKG